MVRSASSRVSNHKATGLDAVQLRRAPSILPRSLSRSEHAQRAGAAPVVQRRAHHRDLAVERDQQPLPARADIGARALEDAEVALPAGEPQNAAAGEPEHRQPALRVGDINTQLAAIEPLTPAESRHAHPILVVADEDDRAAARLDRAFDGDGEPEQRQVAQHARQRQHHRDPFRQPFPPPRPLALQHQIRIEPDRGVVDEDLAVHLADVDGARFSCRDCRHRALHRQRYPEIPGKMIERAERDDPERDAASRQHARDGSHAAVAAADHDRIELAVDRLLPGPLGRGSQLRARQKLQRGRDAVPLERRRQPVAERRSALALDRAGGSVQQRGNA
jgi:hypothetical protein